VEKVREVGTVLNEKKREAEILMETFERHTWIKGKEVLNLITRFLFPFSFSDLFFLLILNSKIQLGSWILHPIADLFEKMASLMLEKTQNKRYHINFG
jgi:hypothetical protein